MELIGIGVILCAIMLIGFKVLSTQKETIAVLRGEILPLEDRILKQQQTIEGLREQLGRLSEHIYDNTRKTDQMARLLDEPLKF